MRSSKRNVALLALMCSGLLGCGRESPALLAEPDSVVALTIKSAQVLPLGGSPGTEPSSVSLRWTQVLTATGGPGATVRASRTELREANSQTIIVATALFGGSLRTGVPLEVPVVVTGVNPALYRGAWEGRVSAEIAHPSGRVETLEAVVSFK